MENTGTIKRSYPQSRAWLYEKQLLSDDGKPLRRSTAEFSGGGNYGVEIPVVNSVELLQMTIQNLKRLDVPCTRFNETRGSFLLGDAELHDMLGLCAEEAYGLVISLGPRPEYDRRATFYRSKFGLEQGRRVNNNEAFTQCVEESLRLAELGCRGLIVYDLGVLRTLRLMKEEGLLPADVMLKTSSHCSVSNPSTATIYRENGANSVTVLHDADLEVLAGMRQLNDGLVLDVPTDSYSAKGGFIRFHELSEIVQVASPVMFKMGASAQSHPYDVVGKAVVEERVKRVRVGLEHLSRAKLEISMMKPDCPHACVPRK
jgi:hypothetical protein